jgi:hypothetical protein
LQRLADSIGMPAPAVMTEREVIKRRFVQQPQLGS